MKKLMIGILCLLCGLTVQAKKKVVEFPYWYYSNTSDLEIKKVVQTDTATILYFKIHCVYRPWQMNTTVHLEVGGKKYAYRSGKLLTKKEGKVQEFPFSLGIDNKAPKTTVNGRDVYEQDSLMVCFDPLPKKVDYLDFIEGDGGGDWTIYGIKLDGKPYPSALPEDKTNSDSADLELPDYAPKDGKAVLKGHIYGYRKEISIGYFVNKNFFTEKKEIVHTSDSLGNYRFEGNLYFPTKLQLTLAGKKFNVMLIPGEEQVLNIDPPTFAAKSMSPVRDKTLKDKSGYRFSRRFAQMNELKNIPSYDLNQKLFSAEFLKNIVKLPFPDFAEYSWTSMKEVIDSIQKESQLTAQQKEYMKLLAENQYVKIRIYYLNLLAHRVQGRLPVSVAPILDSYKAGFTLKDPHAGELTLFKNLKVLYVLNGNYDYLEYLKVNGLDSGEVYQWMVDLKKDKQLASRISLMDPVVNEADWDSIAPEYLPTLQEMNKQVIAQMDSLKSASSTASAIKEPDVPAEQLLQAIADKYKGKVVFVDCWATWCGPCKMGIAKTEPMKSELAGKDVVFVYLTNETSDFTTWSSSIKSIPGDHYRISSEKWDKLPGIQAIPHYFIYDREGKKLFDHESWSNDLLPQFKEIILKALGEKKP
ncbi:MAG: TlpA disulfide reductase family protein [Bacteroidaceae bacterium]